MVSQSKFITRRSQPHITVPQPANAVQNAAQRNAIAAGLQDAVLQQALDVMGEVVQRTNIEHCRSNTKAAYEYHQFCNH